MRTFTANPPLSLDEVEYIAGVDARRLAELAVVIAAIEYNPAKVRELVARDLGYTELADYIHENG